VGFSSILKCCLAPDLCCQTAPQQSFFLTTVKEISKKFVNLCFYQFKMDLNFTERKRLVCYIYIKGQYSFCLVLQFANFYFKQSHYLEKEKELKETV